MNEPHELNPPHECEPIARATPMMKGRDWWIGKLKQPIMCHGATEKYCLHLTTPLKSVTFLLNDADLWHISVLMACAHDGPISERWLKNRMVSATNAANAPDQRRRAGDVGDDRDASPPFAASGG